MLIAITFLLWFFKMRKIVPSSVTGHCLDLWTAIEVSKEPAALLYHEK
jgi:hypothetical protein